MKSFSCDDANDNKNKNKKFQKTSTGQSFESYVQTLESRLNFSQPLQG